MNNVGKNNKNFKSERRLRFAIRKFSVGAASVAVAAFSVLGSYTSASVSAEMIATTLSQQENKKEDGVTPSDNVRSSENSTVAQEVKSAGQTSIVYRVEYVDNKTKEIVHKIPKTTVAQQSDVTSIEITEFATSIPKGYKLAENQSEFVKKEVVKKANNVIIFYVEKISDNTVTSNETEGQSSFRADTLKVTEPAKLVVPAGRTLSGQNYATIRDAIIAANPGLPQTTVVVPTVNNGVINGSMSNGVGDPN